MSGGGWRSNLLSSNAFLWGALLARMGRQKDWMRNLIKFLDHFVALVTLRRQYSTPFSSKNPTFWAFWTFWTIWAFWTFIIDWTSSKMHHFFSLWNGSMRQALKHALKNGCVTHICVANKFVCIYIVHICTHFFALLYTFVNICLHLYYIHLYIFVCI